ncbi:MAG: VOC family protein [Burkholderiaceae bacterium]|jgi:hypothetical protein|nr:VOC family protein [Burkholderiales bacterium]MCZ8108144.1 VOC family protein [Burkholderiales bacterium]MCZ8341331.1 VOC family protein [Burkholderiaceae bacterium]
MRTGLGGFDHGVVLVRDLDAAQDAWRRMGFSTTPRGHHTLGSSNHCMMFGHDYVELLAVPKPHPSMAYFTEFLSRAEGLAAFAFSGEDGLAAHASFVRDGIAADPPFEFSRPVERAGGGDARFRIVQLPQSATPGMGAFVCQHFTPERVWLPEDLVHPNGAVGIAGIVVACDGPVAVATEYGRLADVAPVASPARGARRVRVGRVDFDFVRPEALASLLHGGAPAGRDGTHAAVLRISVADLGVARDALRSGDVPHQALGDHALAVPASFAQGVAVVLEG